MRKKSFGPGTDPRKDSAWPGQEYAIKSEKTGKWGAMRKMTGHSGKTRIVPLLLLAAVALSGILAGCDLFYTIGATFHVARTP